MDWSLVLISQGIDSTVQEPDEIYAWRLEVAPEDYARAIRVLKLYHSENRHWGWRSDLALPGLCFDWGSLAWVFLILVFYWLSEEFGAVQRAGVMGVAAVSHGEWWRLFTAVWLHADVAHLAGNAGIGVVLLGLTMGLYGTGPGFVAAYAAGIGGNFLVWAVSSELRSSLGASGLVMGCLGLLAARPFSFLSTRQLRLKLGAIAAAAGVMLFILLGLAPNTDVLAHFGGFVCGFLLGRAGGCLGYNPEDTRANLVAGFLLVVLTLVPWLFAFMSMN